MLKRQLSAGNRCFSLTLIRTTFGANKKMRDRRCGSGGANTSFSLTSSVIFGYVCFVRDCSVTCLAKARVVAVWIRMAVLNFSAEKLPIRCLPSACTPVGTKSISEIKTLPRRSSSHDVLMSIFVVTASTMHVDDDSMVFMEASRLFTLFFAPGTALPISTWVHPSPPFFGCTVGGMYPFLIKICIRNEVLARVY